MMKYNATKKSSLFINKLSGLIFLGVALSSSSYASGWHCNWGSELTSIVTPSGEHKEVCRAEPKADGVCPEGTSFMDAHVAETGEKIASRCEGPAFYK
jgi:hypothetical protein